MQIFQVAKKKSPIYAQKEVIFFSHTRKMFSKWNDKSNPPA